MNYLTWRQHRNQGAIAVVGLLALLAVMVPSGLFMSASYHDALRSCAATASCANLSGLLFRNAGVLFDIVGLSAAIPLLFGLFWGAPLVAREIEDGTHKLAWTQTVTRRRWLAVKVAWILAGAAVAAAVISALITWWSGPVNALDHLRFQLGHFDTQGLVPVGYTVFAVALGIAAGALLRRTLPALALTLTVFTGIRFAIDYLLRPRYRSPLTLVVPLGRGGPPTSSWWVLRDGRALDPAGHVLSDLRFTPATFPHACAEAITKSPDSVTSCLGKLGYRSLVTYQPANRFWEFQAIETALYLVLAALLVAVAFWVLARRDA